MIPEEEDLVKSDNGNDPSLSDAHDTLKNVDQNQKDFRKYRKEQKGKGKAATQKGGTEVAEAAAKKEAAHVAEEQVAKRVAIKAGAKLAGEAILGVATGGWGLLLMIPDLIKLLKSKYGKWIGGACCVCGCLPTFIILGFFAMFLVIAIGYFGGQGNNMCPLDTEIPGPSEIKIVGNTDCYKSTLMKAEEQTNVPWEIIASLDFRQYGSDSDLNNLLQVGADVQRANRLRDKTSGELILDKDGNTINTITPDINDGKDSAGNLDINVMAAIAIMANYECVYRKDAVTKDFPLAAREELCFRKSTDNSKCQADSGKDCSNGADYARTDPWLVNKLQTDIGVPGQIWDSIVRIPFAGSMVNGAYEKLSTLWGNDTAMGAATFYVDLMHLMGAPDPCKDSGVGASLGGGTPGARGPDKIAILPNFEQWTGGWESLDYMGCSPNGVWHCGCSITSASMVLKWYGCNIDPGIAAGLAPNGENSGQGGSGDVGVFGTLAAACGMCAESHDSLEDWTSWIVANNDPMVIGVTRVINGPYIDGGHFVAVAGFDGINYHVYDPGIAGDLVEVPKAEFEGYFMTRAKSFYPKPPEGCH